MRLESIRAVGTRNGCVRLVMLSSATGSDRLFWYRSTLSRDS